MQCTDLERYLEAFLDGRLGRSRSGLLRRHLTVCLACRTRYHALRQFERDLNKRLRSMERCESVWSGLELDLVKSTQSVLPSSAAPLRALPPPPPRTPRPPAAPPPAEATTAGTARTRRLTSRMMGVLLVAAAAGAIVDGVRGIVAGISGAAMPSAVRLDEIKAQAPSELRSNDPAQVRSWLASRLGSTVPMPPVPEGFQLRGTKLHLVGGKPTGVLLYDRHNFAVQLYLRPTSPGEDTADRLLDGLSGTTRLGWQRQGFAYGVTTTLRPEELVPLVRAYGYYPSAAQLISR